VEAVREFLNSGKGRLVGWGGVTLAAIALLFSLRGYFGDSPAAAASKDRLFICSQTGKTFQYDLKVGDVMPVPSPHSGSNTGYRAELCYWTADGQVKENPTPVLLNEFSGKSGPTYCPECGRLVRAHNPRPEPGDHAPPKQSEMKSSKENR
jgi:hypothetical protein